MSWETRIGRRIKLRDIHVLQAVIQDGSMTRAADRLAISVPAVSKAIADLEHVVGAKLFDRSPHGVEPTTYGKVLLRRGLAAFDELRHGISEIEFLRDSQIGELRIGTTDTLAGLVQTVIERLSKRFPKIVFHITISDAPTLYKSLGDRILDLVIARIIEQPVLDQLNSEHLFNDTYSVVVGRESQWCRRRKVQLAELKDEPWLLPPLDSVAGSGVANAFRAAGLELPRVAVFALSVPLRISFVSTGRYVTILPGAALGRPASGSSLSILPVKLQIAPWPVMLVTPKNRTPSPTAKLFIEYAHKVAAPLASSITK